MPIIFLTCPLYADQRSNLNLTIFQYTTVTLNVLLFGDDNLPLSSNVAIFKCIRKYISDTKRFEQAKWLEPRPSDTAVVDSSPGWGGYICAWHIEV